jgi:hypothetical protein
MSSLWALILEEYSKSHSLFIANIFLEKLELIPEMLELIYSKEKAVS